MSSAALSNARSAPVGIQIELELAAADFHEEWKRCNMLANYLAEYAAYQFPRREMAENLISTVVNELLETVALLVSGNKTIKITLKDEPDALSIYIDHELDADFDRAYPAFIQQLQPDLPDNVYISLLTSGADAPPAFNQLGLAMVVHDFNTNIRFVAPTENKRCRTLVRLSTKELLS